MTGSNAQRGFALLIAVVLSAVAAGITVALTTLAYKGLLLSSAAQESQYAFYAADSALECALYNDSGNPALNTNKFPYQTTDPGSISMDCVPTSGISLAWSYDSTLHRTLYSTGWFDVNGTRCARVSVYRYSDGSGKLYADGVNTTCAARTTDPRAIERSIKAEY